MANGLRPACLECNREASSRTVEAFDLGDERGAALIDASLRRIGARLREIDPERLLHAG